MNADTVMLGLLAVCCVAAAMVQAAEWRFAVLGSVALVLAATLIACSGLASHTSVSDVMRWASSPQRRQDLAALLLAEALLFGSQAVRQARGQARAHIALWLLGSVPAPSALLSLFFSQVAVMLSVDGLDYEVLSWLCGGVFAAVFVAGAACFRWALPNTVPRSVLRVALHGAQAAAGLWLARPAFTSSAGPVPLWGDRLAILAAAVVAMAFAGWLWQRWRGPAI